MAERKNLYSLLNVPNPAGEQVPSAVEPFSFPSEVVRTVGTGLHDAAQAIVDFPKIVSGIDYDVKIPEFTERPTTKYGDVASYVVQFAVPYGAVLKGVSMGSKLFGLGRAATKAQKPTSILRKEEAAGEAIEDVITPPAPLTRKQRLMKYAGAAAVTDFIAFAPNDPTLGNFLQELGADKIPVVNAISELLATDESDSDALNRFRHVMEGLGLGAAIPLIFKGLGKGLSLSGHAVQKVAPKTVSKLAEIRDAKINSLNKSIQHFIDSSHAVRLIDEALENVSPRSQKSLHTALSAWQERRMLASVEQLQTIAYKDGVYIRGANNAMIRLPDHISRQEIEHNIAKFGEDNVDLFQEYLYARQSKQHKATSKGSALDDETTDKIINRVNALPPQVRTAFEKGVTDMQRYNKAILKMLRHEGMINDKTMKALGKVMVNGVEEDRIWVPLLRKSDDEAIELALSMRGINIKTPSKVQISRKNLSKVDQEKLKKYNIDNPLNQAYNNLELGYHHIIKAVAENRAKRVMYDTITKLGEQGKAWAEKAEKTPTAARISGGTLKEFLEKQGVKGTALEDDKIFELFSLKYNVKDNTDIIWRDGVAEMWTVKDPLLMDSLASMGPQLVGDLARFSMRWGGKFKNFLTRMVTSSPTFFAATNWTRDTLSVSILMKGFLPFISSYRGLYHQLFNTELAQRVRRSGGTFGDKAYADFRHAREYQGKNAQRIHTIDGPKGMSAAIGFIDKWTQKFEMASRTEAFRLYTKQGYSDTVAAFKAREIAVDFAQHGSSVGFRVATATVPFLNAHIQGLHRTLRALGAKKLIGKKLTAEEADEVGRAWTNVMAMTITGGIILPMIHYKSEDESIRKTYDEVPVHLKNTNFVVVTPQIGGQNHVLLIPKPFDFGIIPTIAEKFLDSEYIESDAMVIREYLWTALLNSTRMGDASMAPQFIRPLVELKLNKKFTDAPIVPRNLEGGTMAQRRFWTSPTATFFADIAGNANFAPEWSKSPLAIEHILNSYLGTVGGFVMDYITDPAFRAFLEMPDKPLEDEYGRWPWEEGAAFGLGKVLKVLPIRAMSGNLATTRSENELYDAFQRASKFQIDFNSAKDNLDKFTRKQFKEMLRDPETMFFLTQYPLLEQTLDSLARINSAIEVLARTRPENLEERSNLLKARQEIASKIMDVYHGQHNRFKVQQQGMAEGGLVAKTLQEKLQEKVDEATNFVTDPLKAAWRKVVPSNARVFLEHLVGAGDGVQTEDLSKTDIDTLRNAVTRKAQETGESSGQIGYGEYSDKGDMPALQFSTGNQGLVPTIWQSYTDPNFRLETLLGTANYEILDDGTIKITDTYNWNAPSRELVDEKIAEQGGKFKALLWALKEHGFSGMLNLAGNIFIATDDEGEPYTFELPPEEIN